MRTTNAKIQSFLAYSQMVEDSIRQSEDYPTETELWRMLPEKIPRRTLKHILKYLKFDNRIMYGEDHTIIWIQADDLQREILREEFSVLEH